MQKHKTKMHTKENLVRKKILVKNHWNLFIRETIKKNMLLKRRLNMIKITEIEMVKNQIKEKHMTCFILEVVCIKILNTEIDSMMKKDVKLN